MIFGRGFSTTFAWIPPGIPAQEVRQLPGVKRFDLGGQTYINDIDNQTIARKVP